MLHVLRTPLTEQGAFQVADKPRQIRRGAGDAVNVSIGPDYRRRRLGFNKPIRKQRVLRSERDHVVIKSVVLVRFCAQHDTNRTELAQYRRLPSAQRRLGIHRAGDDEERGRKNIVHQRDPPVRRFDPRLWTQRAGRARWLPAMITIDQPACKRRDEPMTRWFPAGALGAQTRIAFVRGLDIEFADDQAEFLGLRDHVLDMGLALVLIGGQHRRGNSGLLTSSNFQIRFAASLMPAHMPWPRNGGI